eukprot:IDg5286t1
MTARSNRVVCTPQEVGLSTTSSFCKHVKCVAPVRSGTDNVSYFVVRLGADTIESQLQADRLPYYELHGPRLVSCSGAHGYNSRAIAVDCDKLMVDTRRLDCDTTTMGELLDTISKLEKRPYSENDNSGQKP